MSRSAFAALTGKLWKSTSSKQNQTVDLTHDGAASAESPSSRLTGSENHSANFSQGATLLPDSHRNITKRASIGLGAVQDATGGSMTRRASMRIAAAGNTSSQLDTSPLVRLGAGSGSRTADGQTTSANTDYSTLYHLRILPPCPLSTAQLNHLFQQWIVQYLESKTALRQLQSSRQSVGVPHHAASSLLLFDLTFFHSIFYIFRCILQQSPEMLRLDQINTLVEILLYALHLHDHPVLCTSAYLILREMIECPQLICPSPADPMARDGSSNMSLNSDPSSQTAESLISRSLFPCITTMLIQHRNSALFESVFYDIEVIMRKLCEHCTFSILTSLAQFIQEHITTSPPRLVLSAIRSWLYAFQRGRFGLVKACHRESNGINSVGSGPSQVPLHRSDVKMYVEMIARISTYQPLQTGAQQTGNGASTLPVANTTRRASISLLSDDPIVNEIRIYGYLSLQLLTYIIPHEILTQTLQTLPAQYQLIYATNIAAKIMSTIETAKRDYHAHIAKAASNTTHNGSQSMDSAGMSQMSPFSVAGQFIQLKETVQSPLTLLELVSNENTNSATSTGAKGHLRSTTGLNTRSKLKRESIEQMTQLVDPGPLQFETILASLATFSISFGLIPINTMNIYANTDFSREFHTRLNETQAPASTRAGIDAYFQSYYLPSRSMLVVGYLLCGPEFHIPALPTTSAEYRHPQVSSIATRSTLAAARRAQNVSTPSLIPLSPTAESSLISPKMRVVGVPTPAPTPQPMRSVTPRVVEVLTPGPTQIAHVPTTIGAMRTDVSPKLSQDALRCDINADSIVEMYQQYESDPNSLTVEQFQQTQAYTAQILSHMMEVSKNQLVEVKKSCRVRTAPTSGLSQQPTEKFKRTKA